jgi:tRNA(adenine34) deaminase
VKQDANRFLEEALKMAKEAARQDEVPVGAVIVREGIVLSRAYNLKESQYNPTGHSEILAILAAAKILQNWRLSGCELYVTLEPCLMCLAACQQARIEKVIFGARDLKGGALSLGYEFHQDPRLNHRFELEYQPFKECEKILTDFFYAKRKKKNL